MTPHSFKSQNIKQHYMAKIHGHNGSLTCLLEELEKEGLRGCTTLEHISQFQQNYNASLHRIRTKHADILRKEILTLESQYKQLSLKLDQKIAVRETILKDELHQLKPAIDHHESRNIWIRLLFFFRKIILTKRMAILENCFHQEVRKPFKRAFAKLHSLNAEIYDKTNNPAKWVERYSAGEIEQEKNINSLFQKHKYLLAGAVGEERVTRELSNLPDTYTVINDYSLEFSPPIYDRKNNDNICSIQIDHVVVGPTGLYLVETKNWSEDSIRHQQLWSPIAQLKRSSFALFIILNKAVERGDIDDFSNRWGYIKISPKNILCFINHKPNHQFQYVKTLSVHQITSYIKNHTQIYSPQQIESLTNNLLA